MYPPAHARPHHDAGDERADAADEVDDAAAGEVLVAHGVQPPLPDAVVLAGPGPVAHRRVHQACKTFPLSDEFHGRLENGRRTVIFKGRRRRIHEEFWSPRTIVSKKTASDGAELSGVTGRTARN